MPSKSKRRRGSNGMDQHCPETGSSLNAGSHSRSPNRRIQPQQQQQRRRSSPKNQVHQKEKGGTSAGGTTTTEGQQSSTEILLKMSDACCKHGDYHRKKLPNSRADPNNNEENLPQRCLQDIRALRQLLPKVEKTIQPQVDSTTARQRKRSRAKPVQKEGAEASDISHLCDFYDTVLNGHFCPHAPHLFQWGKGGIDVLPRVFYLYQHLTTTPIISDSIKPPTSPSQQEGSQQVKSTAADKISNTISSLLSFIPDERLYRCILHDLIHLLVDLSIVVEEGLLTNKSNRNNCQQVQVGFLCDTVSDSQLEDAPEFVLNLTNSTVVSSLQAATYSILYGFLTNVKKQRMAPSLHAKTSVTPILRPGNLDILFYGVLEDGELLAMLFSSMRQVLQTPCCRDHSPTLSLRTKIAASKLLHRLVQDWHHDCVPVPSAIVEVAVLLAHSIKTLLVEINQYDMSNTIISKLATEYCTLVASLLQDVIVTPPTIGGTISEADSLWMIRSPTFSTFLDCLIEITNTEINCVRNSNCEYRSVRDFLATIVLTTIQTLRCTRHWQASESISSESILSESILWNYCNSQRITERLFGLLGNYKLSGHVIGLLAFLLDPMYRYTHSAELTTASLEDLNNVCCEAFRRHTTNLNSSRDILKDESKSTGSRRSISASNGEAPVNAAKRKVKTSLSRFKTTATQSLELREAPPKKQRRSKSQLDKFTSYCDEGSCSSHEDNKVKRFFAGSSLVDFITAALDASKRLEFRDRTVSGRDLDDFDVIDVTIVLNGVRLLLSILERRVASWTDIACEDFESALETICRLAESLKSCCRIAEASLSGGEKSFSLLHRSVLDASITCGIHAQFTFEYILRRLTSSNLSAYHEIFHSFSNIAARLCLVEIPFGSPAENSRYAGMAPGARKWCSLCRANNTALAVLTDAGGSCNGLISNLPLCLCFAGLSDRQAGSRLDVAVQNDLAIAEINAWSLRTRCLLLAALHHEDNTIHEADFESDTVTNALSSFFGDHRSTTPVQIDQSSMVCALVLSPLRLISLSCHEHLKTSDGYPLGASLGERLCLLLSNFLTNILNPASKVLPETLGNPAGAASFLLTFDRLGWLQKTLGLGLDHLERACSIRFSALDVLQYVSGDFGGSDVETRPFSETKQLETVDESLREILSVCIDEYAWQSSGPSVRLALWRCVSGVYLKCPQAKLHELVGRMNSKGVDNNKATTPIPWIISAPFSDPDNLVRDYASSELGRILMSDDCSILFALYSTAEEWKNFNDWLFRCKNQSSDLDLPNWLLEDSEAVTARFFKQLDHLLCEMSCFTESQLSLSLGRYGESNDKLQDGAKKPVGDSAYIQRSALQVLSSLCCSASIEKPHGRAVYEKALLRIVRVWASTQGIRDSDSSFPFMSSTCSGRAISNMALSRISQVLPIGHVSDQHFSERLASSLFCDILIPGADRNRERQHRLLGSFICSFVTPTTNRFWVPGTFGLTVLDALTYVEENLPAIVAQFVAEKDYTLLCLTTCFREYMLDRKLSSVKKENSTGSLVGANAFARRTCRALQSTRQDLEKKTKNLCLEPGLIDRILPLIFMNSDRSGLVFFTRDVLKGMTLHKILTHREQMILKGFVWQLGRDPRLTGQAMRAIRTAAIARIQEPLGFSDGNPIDQETGTEESLGGKETSAASHWISTNFMYLLVNVIQHKWKARSLLERVHAVRCLNGMLDFLLPSESSQYFPQIMATVNASIDQDESRSVDDDASAKLRLLAVQALSKFVRLVDQWEAIAQNLTTLVVSLVPVIESRENISEEDRSTRKSREVAVNLLEYLTAGELGQKLAKKMVEIPFLPASPVLNNVRQSLRFNGVDFDDHLLLSCATQEAQIENRENSTYPDLCSLGSKTSSTTKSSEKIIALQTRLTLVSNLLDNENNSIRQVVLKHTTDLLRANRELFQSLVEREGTASSKRYLTVKYKDSDNVADAIRRNEGGLTTVTDMVKKLLARCVDEAEPETRLLLATCLGEVGAISEHLLGDIRLSGVGVNSPDGASSSHSWRLDQPPWQSHVTKYELRLVTNLLVVALRAAPTSADQHKIAFTIQQLLIKLDNSAKGGAEGRSSGSKREEMTKWLHDKLCESGVYEIVEPFWLSEFSEKAEAIGRARKPPYFRSSSSYFFWISNFCRFMEMSSRDCVRSRWGELFHACRTAVRTQAGLNVAEFILPILILDRLCFGSSQDEETIRQEITDVLDFESSTAEVFMHQTERQKAVNVVFTIIDTLCNWAEGETERRHRSSRANSKSTSRNSRPVAEVTNGINNWPADEALSKIDDLLSSIDLSLQAKAAACVGMHARSLRLLEMATRRKFVDEVFNLSTEEQKSSRTEGRQDNQRNERADTDLLKDVLYKLEDADTLSAVAERFSLSDDPRVQIRDSIRQKEASGHYEAALQDYERALQLASEDTLDKMSERGALRCLLQLGQLEAVLSQVCGLMHRQMKTTICSPGATHVVPFAIEAAWRLGRWRILSDLVGQDETSNLLQIIDGEGKYQVAVGATMLGLQRRDSTLICSALNDARHAIMQSLSTTARESYARSYPLIVRLQSIREMENASEILCKRDTSGSVAIEDVCQSDTPDGWGWDGRLRNVSAQGVTEIINTRLALARLAEEPSLEGSLFLKLGKQARKSGFHTIAANHFSQADAKFSRKQNSNLISCLDDVKMQFAKLKHATGEGTAALKLLGHDNMQQAVSQMIIDRDNTEKIRGIASSYEMRRIESLCGSTTIAIGQKPVVTRFAERLLQITQWMADGGLKGGPEIMEQYRFVHQLAIDWEKGHFKFAKYVESFMKSRLKVLAKRQPEQAGMGFDDDHIRSNIIRGDEASQRYIFMAVRHYAKALTLDSKHVYQALPRLLSLWFEFTSIQKGIAKGKGAQSHKGGTTAAPASNDTLTHFQSEVNNCLAEYARRIPQTSFYTALPQLVSRIIHNDKETALVVQTILKRVLKKFPPQAMWPLAWLKGSRNKTRADIGDQIFRGAEDLNAENPKMQSLLQASDSLFTFLRNLATFKGNGPLTSTVSIEPWKGSVELSEFIPPLQAALSVSTLSSSSNGSKSKDFFPKTVPRMRAFSTRVGVMSSKAKPKRLTAFAVPGTQKSIPRTHFQPSARPLKGDIGEIHFLVKQEAKGDLRKDARVQDLNNVINRLMASSSKSNGSSTGRRRRLQLRTFAVTCLSENVGVIEWCSNTDSMRRLVTQSYNPQASPYSVRRRGGRIADFANAELRGQFDKCQNVYFKNGNLSRAASLFKEICLKPNPPLLYWWFVKQFLDPHAWYETRTRFTISAAVWSAVGHVIGLGDRHSENILIDTTNGDCVHVDFDCIFDKGLDLPKPEVVPFRLTQNMENSFGPTGSDGVFTSGLQTAMRTLRGNRDTLLSVLEPFLKDPIIDWKKSRSQQKKAKGSSTHGARQIEESAAKVSINVIDERLNGIYNFRNPNLRRVRRTDGMSTSEDEESRNVLPLSVEGQVHKMIAEAMSHENLVQLYVGWMPWL